MAEEGKPLEYVGYAIDRGIPFDGVQKAVDFFDGVGILDYQALAEMRSDWFETNKTGEIVGIKPDSIPMQVYVDYWQGMGCKVTQVSDAEAKEIKAALVAKQPIDPKYLKAAVDTRAIAGGKAKQPTHATSTGSENEDAPKPTKGRGKK